MSRLILNDHPWTEDEKAYILARSGGKELVAINEQQFPANKQAESDSRSSEDDKVDLSEEVVAKVKSLDDDAVVSALSEAKLSTEGESAELKFRLAQHLQKLKNAKS